jgi:predicted enzyme related to lactoylglutathione lyase
MSEREHYMAGVPCWVDTQQRDPGAAIQFYGEVLGWDFAGPGQMPGEPAGQYFVARLRGRDVAGVGSMSTEGVGSPAWNTYVSVASADDATERARSAGARVLARPFDVLPAGRMAVLADPTGALFCLWEPRDRRGAQVVNEPSAWAMSVLHTSDPAAANAFYGDAFGWVGEPIEMGDAGTMLWRLPGYVGGEPQQPVPRDVVAVMLPIQADARQSQSYWSVDFWIDDADQAAAAAADLGGTVVLPAHDTPGFRRAVLADPEGAAFSVSKLTIGR